MPYKYLDSIDYKYLDNMPYRYLGSKYLEIQRWIFYGAIPWMAWGHIDKNFLWLLIIDFLKILFYNLCPLIRRLIC